MVSFQRGAKLSTEGTFRVSNSSGTLDLEASRRTDYAVTSAVTRLSGGISDLEVSGGREVRDGTGEDDFDNDRVYFVPSQLLQMPSSQL